MHEIQDEWEDVLKKQQKEVYYKCISVSLPSSSPMITFWPEVWPDPNQTQAVSAQSSQQLQHGRLCLSLRQISISGSSQASGL